MENKIFNQDYNKYWKTRVEKTIDGSKVPDNEVVENLIMELKINRDDRVLDLGCGYGRIFNELSKYSDKICGIDIDMSMVNDSSSFNYHSLHNASAEQTRFPDNYFDRVIALGVFDVVDQEGAIFELGRILKLGGIGMFTGKNINYFENDEAAFVAERNAKLKDFPNHFTDIPMLMANLAKFGFSCEKLFVYLRRGDFGENKKVIPTNETTTPFYEYCIYLKKEKSIILKPNVKFVEEFSQTALMKCKASKEKEVMDFFRKHKENDH